MTYLLIGIKLRLFREAKGWTQREVAEKVGIKLKDYQHLEEAQHEPRSGVILRLMQVTGFAFQPHDTRVRLTGPEVDKLFGRARVAEGS